MLFKDRVHNAKQNVIQFQRKYDYIIYPIVVLIIYIVVKKNSTILKIDSDTIENIIDISSILTGFLFTAHSILTTMPTDKEFIKLLIEYGYFKRMYKYILLAEVSLISCLIISLFEINIGVSIVLFLLGLTYTVLLSTTLFKISFHIMH